MKAGKASVSEVLLDLLEREGCKTVFGVPGAYSIHFVDACASASDRFGYILSSHEAGAAFMAQGYSHVTGNLGCVVTTAGPAALNTVTALASAKSDGDRVVLVHGENPRSRRGRGALQDTSSFGCEIEAVLRPVVHEQVLLDSAADLNREFGRLSRSLRSPGRVTHLRVGADVFSQTALLDGCESGIAVSASERAPEALLRKVEDLLVGARSMLVVVGHGVYQSRSIGALHTFLDGLQAPTLVSARAAACLDPERPYSIGQHSIFSHERVDRYLERYGGDRTDLLLVIGSSLGEFASNGGAEYLRRIPNLVHVNTDPRCFGRLGDHATNVEMDAKLFLERMISSPRLAEASTAIRARNERRLEEFRSSGSMSLYSRLDADLAQPEAGLSGQRLVHAISESLARSLDEETVVNVVADTGSSKLYAAHYMAYRPGSRCILNSGTIDCLGFGLSAAIGAAIGSRDIGEDALTVCFVGDGGLLMNNELNTLAANASLRGLRLIVFVLNDASLSYVHQGFAAVMGRPLEATRFHSQIDFARMAASFGLPSMVVDDPSDVTPAFISEVVEREEFPLVVDCRLNRKVVGPGFSRYNQVRRLLDRAPLSPEEMRKSLG